MAKRKRHTLEMQEIGARYFSQIASRGEQLVQPQLVAIYDGPKDEPRQVATGFVVACKDRPVLLTAKHSLFGESGNENPMTKSIFVSGELKPIEELSSHNLIVDPKNDLVAYYVDEFPAEKCIPLAGLCRDEEMPAMVTILGYLARDFKRDRTSGLLRPAQYVFTNKSRDCGSGYVGLLYPKSLNRSTASGKKVMAPLPSGLSGCPMMNSKRLFEGKVCIIGVFTDQRDGVALGEAASKARALLERLV